MSSSFYNLHFFIAFLGLAVIICYCMQRFTKRILEKNRYDYFRDLMLIGLWFIVVSTFGNNVLRIIVGCSLLSLSIGMVQHVYPEHNLRWLYIPVGFLFSILGPRVLFVGLPGGEYLYLSPIASILVTTLWISMFPILLQEMDNIPGMVGHLLAVTFVLILVVTLISGQDLGNAFMMSFSGLTILALFWSRHGHLYRQLGMPLSAFWGVIVAGTSVLGVSKGITISTLIVIPIGLFAIPIMETSLHFASLALSEKPRGATRIYRELVRLGLDHPTAVHFITLVCASMGAVVTVFQLLDRQLALLVSVFIIGVLSVFAFPAIKSRTRTKTSCRRPSLWGLPIDNVSMNYAVSRFITSARKRTEPVIVITVNALAAYMGKTNELYRKIANRADLSLPDGSGILWALKFLGTPVQERVTGIDFMEQVCRSAAIENIPVYLLGSTQEIVELAKVRLEEKYSGLLICGVRSGYFQECDVPSIIQDIKTSGAGILFVGMGVPRQEQWIYQNIDSIGNICAVGVGGSFDVLSGQLSRAPAFYQKSGLEWFYRLIQEPWRLKRDLDLFLFVGSVIVTGIRRLFTKKVG